MKYPAYIITLTILLAATNLSHACETTPDPTPRSNVPDAGSVYALAAIAAGGLAVARRMVR